MQIAVLGWPGSWYVDDLARAASSRKVALAPIPFRSLQSTISGNAVSVRAEGVELTRVDRVLVRTMPPGSLEQVVFRMDALARVEAAGVPVLNPPRAVEVAVDKYLATARLQAAGLPVPATVSCEAADAAMAAYEALGGDVVVKPIFGSEGRGIFRVSDPDLALRAFRALERIDAVVYLQEFVPHEGADLRAMVVGERMIAAMRRRSTSDWRTNVARGSAAEPIELTDQECSLALKAARAVGAPLAGVDLLPARDGTTYVLEVNAVPGWKALAEATGCDVAGEVLDYLVRGEWTR
jgi:ribosomal protein S6--L-glutamate ligase